MRRVDLRPLAALLLLTGAASAAEVGASYSYASAKAASLPVLAKSLLGEEHAADVVGVSVNSSGPSKDLLSVTFLHKPVPSGKDFCKQKKDYVSFTAAASAKPPSAKPPVIGSLERRVKTSGRILEVPTIALAPDCHMLPGQSFVQSNQPVTIDTTMTALTDFAAVQKAARDSGALPFKLTCKDEMNVGGCAPDERKVLASLPAERAVAMDLDGLTLSAPNDVLWKVRIGGLDTDRAVVSIIRQISTPF